MNYLANFMIAAENATGAIDAATKTIIQGGFDSIKGTAIEVVGMAVIAAVAVIGVSAGAKYALKQIKGVLGKAS